jgi:hypothetical protein
MRIIISRPSSWHARYLQTILMLRVVKVSPCEDRKAAAGCNSSHTNKNMISKGLDPQSQTIHGFSC